MRCLYPLFALLLFLPVVSCEKPEEKADSEPQTEKASAPPAKPPVEKVFWSEVKLHEAIRKANPGYSGNGQFQIDEAGQVLAVALDNCGMTDLTVFEGMALRALYLQGCPVPDVKPLKGMPMIELYLENTAVKDLSPLEGMTELRKLYLSGTMVEDLSPLKGLAITELNLVNTPVKDLSALKGMPLNMLWLTDTPVRDISPLSGSPMVSLTLHRTPVTDLSPLANTNLQRLHIGETDVKDLSPLAGLRLTRLVFDPADIEKGVEAVKRIPTLREVGTKFEDGANDLKPPAVFWGAAEKPTTAPQSGPRLPGPRIENLPPTEKADTVSNENPKPEGGDASKEATPEESPQGGTPGEGAE